MDLEQSTFLKTNASAAQLPVFPDSRFKDLNKM
jgi:hypothetical protein